MNDRIKAKELYPEKKRFKRQPVGGDVPARRKPMKENYPVGPEVRPYQFLIHLIAFVGSVVDPAVDQRSKKLVPLFVDEPGYL